MLLLRALAQMRQAISPLRLRNLLIGHHGEAALRLVKNTCNLVPIEVVGIMIPIPMSKVVRHLWHTENKDLLQVMESTTFRSNCPVQPIHARGGRSIDC